MCTVANRAFMYLVVSKDLLSEGSTFNSGQQWFLLADDKGDGL